MPLIRFQPSPVLILTSAAVLAVAGPALAIFLATGTPSLGLPDGAVPTRVGTVALIPTDLTEEPDQLGRFDAMHDFFKRQTLISAALAQPEVAVAWTMPDGTSGTARIVPRPRGIADLPAPFWFQQVVGMLALLVGGWVLSLRRQDWGAAMFGLTSLFVPVFALSASVYSTREIALDGGLFRVLSGLNHFGAVGFGTALVALFLMYPRPLVRARWLLPPFGIYVLLYTVDQMRLGQETIVPFLVMSQMLGAILIALLQWWRSRSEPLDRAGLRWFFLTSLAGCALFIGLSVMPPAIGLSDTGLLPQAYAFGFFNVMHVGLALGVTRWRVFELDRYSYYIWLWLGGAALVFAVDLALVGWLQTQPWASLSAALLIGGFLYFPLRQVLLRWLFTSRSVSVQAHIADVLAVALAPTGRQQNQRWDSLLHALYAPAAAIEPMAHGIPEPRITETGLALEIPANDGLAARRLRYAAGGRRLFNSADVDAARTLIQINTLVSQSRDAFETGINVERERISRDVHDNIGAQLLSALHTPEGPRKDDLLRDTLGDLRNIINDGFNARFALQDLCADLGTELGDRLELNGIALDWPQCHRLSGQTVTLDFRQANTLRSILREAASNTIKHAGASRLTVALALTGSYLMLTVQDNGCGFDPETTACGNGLANIEDRARILGGQARIDGREGGGTSVHVTLPLITVPPPAAPRHSSAMRTA